MLLIDNDDELPEEPEEDEARFGAAIGAEGVGRVDAALVAHARREWMKVARIIHDAIASGGFPYADGVVDYHARRVLALVSGGFLEAQGNLHKPRYSEVRLPASGPEDER